MSCPTSSRLCPDTTEPSLHHSLPPAAAELPSLLPSPINVPVSPSAWGRGQFLRCLWSVWKLLDSGASFSLFPFSPPEWMELSCVHMWLGQISSGLLSPRVRDARSQATHSPLCPVVAAPTRFPAHALQITDFGDGELSPFSPLSPESVFSLLRPMTLGACSVPLIPL